MDADLNTEMLALENKQGKTNSLIEHAPGYTDDRIDSWLLSCYHYLRDDTNSTKAFDWDEEDEKADGGVFEW